MKKFDLPRAIVTLEKEFKLNSDYENVKRIKDYKTALLLEQRGSERYKLYLKEVQKYRSRLKEFRCQTFIFNVYVKKYKILIINNIIDDFFLELLAKVLRMSPGKASKISILAYT